MMTLIKSRLWCAFLILTAQLGAVQAQTLIGFDFDTSNYPAWDFSGAYQLDQPISGAGNAQVPLTYTVYMTHSSKGKLSGGGTIPLNIDGQVVAADYKLTGNVSGGGNGTRVNFSVSFKGQDSLYGNFQKFNGQVNYKLNVNPTDFTLVGTARGNVSIGGSGGNQVKVDAALPLPTGVDGSWKVNMAITPLKQFIGTGTMEIAAYNSPDLPGWPPTRILYADISGSYNNSKMVANTHLKGIDNGIENAKGSDLNVKIQLTDEFPFYEVFPLKMNGKVLGQKIKW